MDLRKKFKLDYATFLQMSQCLASKLRDEFNPDIIACVARGGLSFSHVLSLELGIPCVMYEPGVYYPDKNVLVVDDSVGTGATLESIHEECNYARWTFAAFYADESYGGVHPVDFCCMYTSLWVVMPWEDPDKIVPGDRKSLFRDGTDPYQKPIKE